MQKVENKRILFIDYCNYEDYQIGGHLSWAKNMLSAFSDDLALVGITTERNEPCGKWYLKTIKGTSYDYFALRRYNKSRTKHFIPDRLECFFLLRFYKSKILEINIQNVFIQRHEILPAVINFGFRNICYRFPGLESPLEISKYWFGKYFAEKFDILFFKCLRNVTTVLASGDEDAIADMVKRSNGIISGNSVIKFPTRINTDIYKPQDKNTARAMLNLPENKTIFVTTGRLASLKGWKFMVDCFERYLMEVKDSILYFVGEGEDHEKIIEYIRIRNLDDQVILAGERSQHEISLFLNASDLFIMGSYKEGWSTSLSEAIACGIPACVTNFSSAKEIIEQGVTGYVVEDHDIDKFIQAMLKSIIIPRPVNNEKVKAYSTGRLREDILNYWRLI